MRQMPSVTETTVPWVRTSAPSVEVLDLALDQFADFGWIELHACLRLSLSVVACDVAQLASRPSWRRAAPRTEASITSSPTCTRDAADQLRVDGRPAASILRLKRFSSAATSVASCASSSGNARVDRARRPRPRARSSAPRTCSRDLAAAASRRSLSTSTRTKFCASRVERVAAQRQRTGSFSCSAVSFGIVEHGRISRIGGDRAR